MVAVRVEDLGLTYRLRRPLRLAPRDRRLAAVGGRIAATGEVVALEDVSFRLEAGDRLALVGTNGAGKTTLLKVLYGIFAPSRGAVAIEGRVDALFDIGLGFRGEATGRRNIELRGLMSGWSRAEIARRMEEIVAFSELGPFIDLPLKAYSQGMAARLAFSIATSLAPEILLLDEWLGAGDAAFQAKARERLEALTKAAGILVFASHNAALLQATCNKVLELDGGRVRRFGPMQPSG